ncbi:oligosaccharide flippase family protein [Sphingomonas radiodurans]|uniref:oligosaccharide flippase family protein n=1 Tax=Sphingomonas radiodurans TaxID=2890321 RepID=UPI001E60233D|nr:oligosaccharide flippase family protein [Sphingomonas radiodurans]WBH18081.1 oligosaccharide flippase family protein [Sphingomonas radiodurans]
MLGKNILSMSGLSLYRNIIQFGMNIAIAAFVSPGDYGLVVFTAPFLVLVAMLTDLGMTSAITRAPSLSNDEAGAALGAMMTGGLVCAVLLIGAAWPIERAIGMAGLAPVMASMAGVVLLSITSATPRALLERELRYARIAGIEAAAIAVAAVAGVVAAFSGAGIWSLVLYNLLTQVIRLAAYGWHVRATLRPNLQFGRLGTLLSFGGWVLGSNLLNFFARNSDNLLIGAWLGAAAVGVYGLSYQFMLAPLMAITWPTSGILLATLRDRDPHGPAAQAMVESVLSATALLVIPTMLYLMFGLAFPMRALLSDRWAQVPAIVSWLAPAGALQAIASYNGALLMVAGRARAQFVLTVVNVVLLVATFVLALPFGLMALVKAYTVVVSLLSLAFIAMMVALTGLGLRRLAGAIAPALLASGLGVLAVVGVGEARSASWLGWAGATAAYAVAVLVAYAAQHLHVRRTLAVLLGRTSEPATNT